MIQSHYVPLAPPYRIIYTGGTMGLQIGTLIIVRIMEFRNPAGRPIPEKDTYSTVTHPVVSYVNKANANVNHISNMFMGGQFSEAVVWDKVDQSDVSTVCMEGGQLEWDDFMSYIIPIMAKCSDSDTTRQALNEARRFVNTLYLLNGKIEFPLDSAVQITDPTNDENVNYMFHLPIVFDSYSYDETEASKCFCTEFGTTLPFIARTEDRKVAEHIFRRQLHFYKTLFHRMGYSDVAFYFNVDFMEGTETDKEVQTLVEHMNKLEGHSDGTTI